MTYSDKLEDHFYSHVRITSDDDCHRWTGARDPAGHGLFLLTGRVEKAHRLAAALSGMEIGGSNVCHICNNPECVNPGHLYIEPCEENDVTGDEVGDNLEISDQSNRATKEGTHDRSKLTRREVISMRKGRDQGLTLADLSARHGVSKTNVRAITTGRRWKEVGSTRTGSWALSDRDVAWIRREYWYTGNLQKHLASAFDIQTRYVSMLVRGRSRPDAPGPTSDGLPPVPRPQVWHQIQFAVGYAGASVSEIEATYGLSRPLVIAILRGEVQQFADSVPEEDLETE